MLQILDDGRITDSQGRLIDFKNTIIILTSNLGASDILDGVREDGTISVEATSAVQSILKRAFRPELLNRLDEIIMFKPLTKNQIIKIVDLQLEKLSQRLESKQLLFSITDNAKEQVVEQGYDVSFGARPLKRFIQSVVEVLVAKTMLQENIKPNTTILVDEKDGEFFVKLG